MGSPKALTLIGGEPAVSRLARLARTCGCDVVVVTRTGIELPPMDARVIVNPMPDVGRTGSLQRGLAATSARVVLVWPVDRPLAGEEVIRALFAERGEWVVPTFGGAAGHPILLRGVAIDAVLTAPPQTPLRDIASAVGIVPVRVPVPDAGVLANLDTPEALREASSGRRHP